MRCEIMLVCVSVVVYLCPVLPIGTESCDVKEIIIKIIIIIEVAEQSIGSPFQNDHQYHDKSRAVGDIAVYKATENMYAYLMASGTVCYTRT